MVRDAGDVLSRYLEANPELREEWIAIINSAAIRALRQSDDFGLDSRGVCELPRTYVSPTPSPV
jgi:hypothetical protein